MLIQHNDFFFLTNKSIIERKGVCPRESIQKKTVKKNNV